MAGSLHHLRRMLPLLRALIPTRARMRQFRVFLPILTRLLQGLHLPNTILRPLLRTLRGMHQHLILMDRVPLRYGPTRGRIPQ